MRPPGRLPMHNPESYVCSNFGRGVRYTVVEGQVKTTPFWFCHGISGRRDSVAGGVQMLSCKRSDILLLVQCKWFAEGVSVVTEIQVIVCFCARQMQVDCRA